MSYFIARLLVQREYWSHFGERLGLLPRSFTRTNARSIWLHAVSVGEVLSAVPLIDKLRDRYPMAPIYLSTSTVAGRRAAERYLDSPLAGIFYSPIDYASCVRRVLKVIRPALLVVLETEIWPNLYAETKRTGAALAVVNGRISDRAWPRYARWKRFFAPLLQLPDLVFAQSETDFSRYGQLGVPGSHLHLEANLKYDAATPRSSDGIETFGAGQIWIAASTAGPNERGSLKRHSIDEDDIVIETFQALASEFPRLLLILAPRQPARFSAVARKLEAAGVRFLQRSRKTSARSLSLQLPGVLLLDTIGELSGTYPHADVVFVGGSLAPRGGHNIVEPAAAAAALIVGPHMHNFDAIMSDFRSAGAILQIERASSLLPTVRDLLTDPARARNLGARAHQLVEQKRGVSARLAENLLPLYQSADLLPPRNLVARYLLRALAFLWREGGAIKRVRQEREASSLSPLGAPVVSIGAITVGGAGKTPFTVYLAGRLRERGFAPAVLTRGYGRRSPARTLIFAPGTQVPVAVTGDEAQIYLRTGTVPIGIGANRSETARLLLSRFPSTGILLLDDAFQHARIRRDLDVVVIDGIDPFGQDGIVPLGRLREPLSALQRANIFVVTRVDSDLRFESICARLREYNATAPIFRAQLLARRWRRLKTDSEAVSLPSRRVAAFCGIGNPENFWRTLESLGLEIVFRWSFDDHHSYQSFELQRIARQAQASGAEILVTTEKDRMNCPEQLERAISPFDLAWLEIDLAVENEPAFFNYFEQALQRRAVA